MIGVSLADEWMGLYLRSSEYQDTPRRAQRMLQYSRRIREQMGDQEFDGNEQSRSRKGRSVTVRRAWDRDDQDGWLEAARWIKDQAERMQAIAERLDTVPGEMATASRATGCGDASGGFISVELALILRVSRPKV